MEHTLLEQLYSGGYMPDDLADSLSSNQKEQYRRYCEEAGRLLHGLDAETAAGVQRLLDLHG